MAEDTTEMNVLKVKKKIELPQTGSEISACWGLSREFDVECEGE